MNWVKLLVQVNGMVTTTLNGLINMEARLLDLIKEYGTIDSPIKENTRIYHDLNIYGDDAIEFLQKYAETFGVDVLELKFNDYFPTEGDSITRLILRIFKPKPTYKELTISKLLNSIQSKHLE